MTIDEAIKHLTEHSNLILVDKNPELKNAMRLGIEALKWAKGNPWTAEGAERPLLPGETEEE